MQPRQQGGLALWGRLNLRYTSPASISMAKWVDAPLSCCPACGHGQCTCSNKVRQGWVAAVPWWGGTPGRCSAASAASALPRQPASSAAAGAPRASCARMQAALSRMNECPGSSTPDFRGNSDAQTVKQITIFKDTWATSKEPSRSQSLLILPKRLGIVCMCMSACLHAGIWADVCEGSRQRTGRRARAGGRRRAQSRAPTRARACSRARARAGRGTSSWCAPCACTGSTA